MRRVNRAWFSISFGLMPMAPMSDPSTSARPDEARFAGSPQTRVGQSPGSSTILLALGIVYGDLGTSPLYTLQTIKQIMGQGFSAEVALGSLSLIVWALIITISVKYGIFVMRADNHGEGGILALMAITGTRGSRRGRWLVVAGLFGAALIYGDGIITPAISVLSAVEGLNVATSVFKPYTMPIAVAILVGLFALQSRGTATVGRAFGPVMLLWFITMGLLGLVGVAHHVNVLTSLDPRYGIKLLFGHGQSLHQTVIALTVSFEPVPRIKAQDRIRCDKLGEGVWHMTVHFGFVEIPDLPSVIAQANTAGCPPGSGPPTTSSAMIRSIDPAIPCCRAGERASSVSWFAIPPTPSIASGCRPMRWSSSAAEWNCDAPSRAKIWLRSLHLLPLKAL